MEIFAWFLRKQDDDNGIDLRERLYDAAKHGCSKGDEVSLAKAFEEYAYSAPLTVVVPWQAYREGLDAMFAFGEKYPEVINLEESAVWYESKQSIMTIVSNIEKVHEHLAKQAQAGPPTICHVGLALFGITQLWELMKSTVAGSHALLELYERCEQDEDERKSIGSDAWGDLQGAYQHLNKFWNLRWMGRIEDVDPLPIPLGRLRNALHGRLELRDDSVIIHERRKKYDISYKQLATYLMAAIHAWLAYLLQHAFVAVFVDA